MLEALSCVLSRWLIVARSLVSSSTVVHVGWTVICFYMSHDALAVHTAGIVCDAVEQKLCGV